MPFLIWWLLHLKSILDLNWINQIKKKINRKLHRWCGSGQRCSFPFRIYRRDRVRSRDDVKIPYKKGKKKQSAKGGEG